MADGKNLTLKQLSELSSQLGKRAGFSKQALAVERQYLAETNPVKEERLYNEMWHLRRQASDASYAIRQAFGIRFMEMGKADAERLMAEKRASEPRKAVRRQ
ncbi:MAG: hypothetical protein WC588_05110 [Candidatus Micrarchaeia archaeon]